MAVYSLDEFYPIRSSEQQSRNYRIHEEFLNHIDIQPENIHIPDGTVPEESISAYCASFDQSVRRIDLMIIGMGEQGQIGFNEPGEAFELETHCVDLTSATIEANKRFFDGNEDLVPKQAYTMGIKTIMQARKVLVVANGLAKAKAVKAVVSGPVTPECPGSILQMHPDCILVADEEALSLL